MKKLLLILFVFAAFSATAQKVDSVKNAVQVQPYVINALKKDTVYQVRVEKIWLTPHDTTGADTYVVMYDRKGRKVSDDNIHVPYEVTKVWLDDVVIDDYIILFLGLTKRN